MDSSQQENLETPYTPSGKIPNRFLICSSIDNPLLSMDTVHTKLWIHAILTTKNFRQLITPSIQSRLDNFIHDKLLELGCPTRIIHGMPEHVHILFLQNPARSIAEIIKKIKSTSSFFINENHLSPQKFYWQPGYAAFSVSESQVQKAYDYIGNQPEHHLKEKFIDEYQHLLQLHGLLGEKE